MTDHLQKFIFVQALGKPVVEHLLKAREMGLFDSETEVKRDITQWTHWLYDLAGELGPQDQNPDIERVHPNTANAVIKRILHCISEKDGLGLLEIRDEWRQGQWAGIVQKLYTHDAKAMKELIQESEALMAGEGP